MKLIYAPLILIALLTSTLCNAQQDKVEEVQGKAANKAEGRLDSRVDEGLEKGLNALEGVFGKKKKKKKKKSGKGQAAPSSASETNSGEQKAAASLSELKQESTADLDAVEMDFVGSYVLTMNSTKKGKEQGQLVFEYYFNKNTWAMVSQEKNMNMRIIMDFDALRTTMLTQDEKGQKTGIVMKMQAGLGETVADNSDAGEQSVERTGNTKMIDGKLCHEYLGQNEDGKYQSWIDESADMNMAEQWAAFSKKKNAGKDWQQVPNKGIMMETNWTSADGKETVHILTSNVNIGSVDMAMFETEGFELIDMTNMPGLGGK